MNKNEKEYFYCLYNENFSNKYEIKNKIKKIYEQNLPYSNVNSSINISLNFNFKYEYQRYDSMLSYKEYDKLFYNIQNLHTKTIFTNCGMSAIYSLLLSFKMFGNYNFVKEKDIYFETNKLLKLLKLNKGKKIYYYDTISDNYHFDINKQNKIIIIDTTCYHSHDFTGCINKLINNSNIVILVRSHIKLDMLGLEYSSLGSVSYIIPDKISFKRFDDIKKIIKNNLEIAGNIGMLATENNIFPLLNDAKLIRLNKERIRRINHNNDIFYAENKKIETLKSHKHELFTTLIVGEKDTARLIDFVKEKAINSKGLFFYSPSFGFDYIAVDTYYDTLSKNNTIRISIGDVSIQTIKEFSDYFRREIYDKI